MLIIISTHSQYYWSVLCSFPESSPQYKTMLSCMSELITTIAQAPQQIYDEMIAAGFLIKLVQIREFIRHPTHTDYEKATKLVHFMTGRVKTSPEDFHRFMAVLKRLPWTKRIVDILQSSYQLKFDDSLVEARIRMEKEVNYVAAYG